jgi:hypothetical protein
LWRLCEDAAAKIIRRRKNGELVAGNDFPANELIDKFGTGDEMFIRRIGCTALIAGFCSIAVSLIGVATSASSTSKSLQFEPLASVERAGKSDCLTHVKGSAGGAIAVELTGTSNVVIRDREGNILFAVDHAARTTTVGKQRKRGATTSREVPGVVKSLPDGCEGAFSPYADPARAHVIGRCVSSVFSGTVQSS